MEGKDLKCDPGGAWGPLWMSSAGTQLGFAVPLGPLKVLPALAHSLLVVLGRQLSVQFEDPLGIIPCVS